MKVFTITTLAFVIALSACNNKLKIETNSFNLDVPFQLKVQETAKMVNGDLQLTITGLPEDSRCPQDVNCVWEGQVRLFVTAAIPSGKENLEFKVEKSKMGKVRKSFGNYAITVEDVQPLPQNGLKTPIEDYFVTFVVEEK
ncbi:MAG: hypothetical protein AAFZ15_11525 [Bacteroidota bacterium]